MTWPTDDISTSALDSQNDRPPRAEFFKLFQRVKTIIAGRGRAGGVASLGANGKIPDGQLPPSALQSVNLGSPNGAASLDGNGDVPLNQIPNKIARLQSPALTGNPTAPTQPAENNSTRLATTEFVKNAIRITSRTIMETTTTTGGSNQNVAGANVSFSIPMTDRALMPIRVSTSVDSSSDYWITTTFEGRMVTVWVRTHEKGSEWNDRTVTVEVSYDRLVIA